MFTGGIVWVVLPSVCCVDRVEKQLQTPDALSLSSTNFVLWLVLVCACRRVRFARVCALTPGRADPICIVRCYVVGRGTQLFVAVVPSSVSRSTACLGSVLVHDEVYQAPNFGWIVVVLVCIFAVCGGLDVEESRRT